MDIPQNTLLGFLHHDLYRLMIPFKVLFHSLIHIDFGKDGI